MSGRWWRAYSRARHDPKLLKLSDKNFRWWFNFVSVAADNDGVLPSHADLVAEFRTTDAAMTQAIDALISAGLFDHDETGVRPHNWNGLQYKSDVSTERVKRFREQQSNGDETFPKRPQRSESETEADTEQKEEKERGGAVAPLPTVEAVDLFNTTAEQTGWPRVQVLNPARKRALAACLHAVGGLEGWQTLIAKAAASDFLSGRARRSDDHANWRMDFDFLLKRHIKIMEGGYDNSPNSQRQPERGLGAVLAALAD